jgi:hypothetical protein
MVWQDRQVTSVQCPGTNLERRALMSADEVLEVWMVGLWRSRVKWHRVNGTIFREPR